MAQTLQTTKSGTHHVFYFQNWLTFSKLHKPLFTEYGSVKFLNTNQPKDEDNNAYCEVRRSRNVPAMMLDHDVKWRNVFSPFLVFLYEVRKHLLVNTKPLEFYKRRIKGMNLKTWLPRKQQDL